MGQLPGARRLCALALVVGGWGATSPAVANQPMSGDIVAKVGDAHVLRISSRGTSRVNLALATAAVSRALNEPVPEAKPGEGLQSSQFHLAAELHSRVISADAKGWTEAARLQEVSFEVDGAIDARKDLLSTPFLIRRDRSGRMASFTFPKRFPRELQGAVQRLVEPLQVSMGPEGASSWTAEEQQFESAHSARYELIRRDSTSLAMRRIKTAVTPRGLVEAAIPIPGRPSSKVNRSESTFEFDLSRRALAKVTASESVSTYWGRTLFGDYDYVYEAQRVERPIASLPATPAEAETTLADPAFARARFYDVDLQSRALVEGLDLSRALSAYRVAVAKKTGQGSRLLKTWLRLNPGKSLEIARQIDLIDPAKEEMAFEFGWASLASAGHQEAQEALLSVITGPDWKPVSKEKALIATMSLESPSQALVAAVWKEHRALAERPDANPIDISIVTNVYGSLGDVKKENPALTAEVVKNLKTLLARPDSRSRSLALSALSNVGDFATVAPLAAPHLTSPDARVRVAAFSTFRRMEGEEAFDKFAAAFSREGDRKVRHAAARIAWQMPSTRARNEWARSLVAKETDPKVQSEMVQLLGKNLSAHPENAQTLQDLLKTVRDRGIRKDIYAYVSPAVKGGGR